MVGQYVYDAWGNHTIVTDIDGIATLNPIRYRGYYYDQETGLYYVKSRYYDPTTGRWISPDMYVSTGQGLHGYNMYSYCNNNPVLFRDSTGTRPIASATVKGESWYDRFISCDYQKSIALNVKKESTVPSKASSSQALVNTLQVIGQGFINFGKALWATVEACNLEVGGGLGFRGNTDVGVGEMGCGFKDDLFSLHIGNGKFEVGEKSISGFNVGAYGLSGVVEEGYFHPYNHSNCTLPENPTHNDYLECPGTTSIYPVPTASIGIGFEAYFLIGVSAELSFDVDYWCGEIIEIYGGYF